MEHHLDYTFFTWIFGLPDHVVFNILSFCSIKELMALGGACWHARCLILHYQSMVWSFQRRFQLWFPNTAGFQAMLYRHKAIVSGSQAIQFFDRTFCPDDPLEIYVRHNRAPRMFEWIESQGYFAASNPARSYDAVESGTIQLKRALDHVERLYDATWRRRQIRIIATIVRPIDHILCHNHSCELL